MVDLTGFRRSQGVTLQPITFAVLVFSLIVLRVSAVEDEFGLDAEPARGYELTMDAEIDDALLLAPNLDNGRRIFQICTECHKNNAWGSDDGEFPQIAGQHRSVIIKQIADIRYGNRDNPTMLPFAQRAFFESPQGFSDVAGYLSSLPVTPRPGIGPGNDLEYGAQLYKKNCSQCHEDNGMGDDETYFPRIQGQHFEYLVRQLKWIRAPS
ncbi:MAG: c-type cytochrome [Pseudomonadales bacterium]|nr:c-type cytochrome [Pseudomonadales bacterium]MDP7594281.1 c-type cytochrome [Pseudomonadales bacterium]